MSINPPGSNNGFIVPSAYSPLSIQGHSIIPGVLTCNEGQWSNISEVLRQPFQAKTLNNFQMLTRGIWSCPTGIGWTLQRSGTFNSGAAFMDFGVYEDFLGNQTMLFQVGSQVYSYDLATSTETAYDAPLTGLSTSLAHLPCMRSFVDNTGTVQPITVYTNGAIQPVAITGTAASDVEYLGFTGTGSPTTTNPNGGVFDISYPISTFSVGSYITQYAITASGTPQNCCLGPDGNVWYTDYHNSKVGKITPAGQVTEYATTTGSAGPYGICSDGTNLWITEKLANQIAKVTTAGVFTEYSTDVPTAPTGICYGPLGYVWVCATGSVEWVAFNGGTYATEGSTSLENWQDICVGPDGDIWGIGTTYSGGVTFGKMTPAGTFTSYAANANASTQGYSICAGPNGTIWFADNGTNQIAVSTTSGSITYYKTPTPSSGPWGICLGTDGNIWFTENAANKLGRVLVSNGTVTEYVGIPAAAGLQGICVGSDNNLWFCEEANVAIGTAILQTSNPRGIASGPDGNLWIAEYGTNKIAVLTPTGTLTEYILPNAHSGPLDIASDGTNLWFTEYLGNRIGKITTAGVITEYALSTPHSNPVGICLGPDGNMWFTESNNNKVAKITSSGSITEYSCTTSASVPWGICSNGTYLYACESVGNNIARFTTGGTCTEYVIPTAACDPLWIALGSDGRLWFTENAANKIGAMTTGGAFTEYLIPTSSALPLGITAASDGDLYFVESGANQIGQITTTGTITEFPVPVNTSEPYGIVDGPDQSIWFTLNGASEVGNFLYGGSGTFPGVFQLTKKTYSKPRFSTYFNNRMAYFGFDPSSNAALDVLISNQSTASSFITSTPIQATDAVSFTIPGLGLPTGMTAFRLTNTNNQEVLILGFQRGIAVVMGNGVSSDATTYAADILTSEYGLMSNRTFTQIQNDMYFLSTNGVRNFTNLTVNANLLNSNLTYQMQDIITGITTDLISGTNVSYNSQAFAVHHRDTLEVQYWFPNTNDGSDGADFTNQHAIIMNYNIVTPTPQNITPVFSTKSGTSVACGIEFQGTMYGGGYDGHLQVHYDGNSYNGTPIPGTLNLALINGGNVQQNIELRQGQVITEGEDQNFQVLTFFYTKQADGTMARTPSPEQVQTLSAVTQGETILGGTQYVDWTLGYSSFPANHIKHLYFEATGEGPYIEFIFTVNGEDQSLDFAGVAYTITVGGLRP